jgi:hypothetical protein
VRLALAPGVDGLLLCLAASQVVFHIVLAAEHDAAHLQLALPHAAMVATGGAMHVTTGTVLPGTAEAVMPAGSSAMLLAHVLAVLLSAVVLRHGERCQLRIVELLAGILRGFSFPLPHPVPDPSAPCLGERPRTDLHTQTRLTSVLRRGPPRPADPAAWSIAPTWVCLTPP